MSIDMEHKIKQQDASGPFKMVLKLANECGDKAIIAALAEVTESLLMEMGDDVCVSCQMRAAWLQMELWQLLERYELLFPDLEPEVQINHRGLTLVQ
jgi:hypothetical protein